MTGGNGADGQLGQPGGAGAVAEANTFKGNTYGGGGEQDDGSNGVRGGPGGAGGKGGTGGAGAGGPSIGILLGWGEGMMSDVALQNGTVVTAGRIAGAPGQTQVVNGDTPPASTLQTCWACDPSPELGACFAPYTPSACSGL